MSETAPDLSEEAATFQQGTKRERPASRDTQKLGSDVHGAPDEYISVNDPRVQDLLQKGGRDETVNARPAGRPSRSPEGVDIPTLPQEENVRGAEQAYEDERRRVESLREYDEASAYHFESDPRLSAADKELLRAIQQEIQAEIAANMEEDDADVDDSIPDAMRRERVEARAVEEAGSISDRARIATDLSVDAKDRNSTDAFGRRNADTVVAPIDTDLLRESREGVDTEVNSRVEGGESFEEEDGIELTDADILHEDIEDTVQTAVYRIEALTPPDILDRATQVIRLEDIAPDTVGDRAGIEELDASELTELRDVYSDWMEREALKFLGLVAAGAARDEDYKTLAALFERDDAFKEIPVDGVQLPDTFELRQALIEQVRQYVQKEFRLSSEVLSDAALFERGLELAALAELLHEEESTDVDEIERTDDDADELSLRERGLLLKHKMARGAGRAFMAVERIMRDGAQSVGEKGKRVAKPVFGFAARMLARSTDRLVRASKKVEAEMIAIGKARREARGRKILKEQEKKLAAERARQERMEAARKKAVEDQRRSVQNQAEREAQRRQRIARDRSLLDRIDPRLQRERAQRQERLRGLADRLQKLSELGDSI